MVFDKRNVEEVVEVGNGTVDDEVIVEITTVVLDTGFTTKSTLVPVVFVQIAGTVAARPATNLMAAH